MKEGLFFDGVPDTDDLAYDEAVQNDGEREPKVKSPNEVPLGKDDGST
jgi:hypothetical protein